MKLKKVVESLFVKFNRRRGRLNKLIYAICMSYRKAYENINYNFVENGERFVLERIANHKPVVLFDVGGNEGEWSLMAGDICSSATLHVFEIVPTTYEILSLKLSSKPGYILNNIGLSSFSGEVEVYQDKNKNTHSTILKSAIGRKEFKPILAEVMKGDEYCSLNDVGHIDFLKIDVEGVEHEVLSGFEGMLTEAKVSVIQFEYTELNIDSRFLLKDFYEYLEKFGYKLGKLYPYGVLFKAYEYRDEDFKGPNYIAVHGSRADLIEALSFAD